MLDVKDEDYVNGMKIQKKHKGDEIINPLTSSELNNLPIAKKTVLDQILSEEEDDNSYLQQ